MAYIQLTKGYVAVVDGQEYSPNLGYIPLPDNVVEKVKTKLEE